MWQPDSDETLLIYRNRHNIIPRKMSLILKGKRKHETVPFKSKSKSVKSMSSSDMSLSKTVNRLIKKASVSSLELKYWNSNGHQVLTYPATGAQTLPAQFLPIAPTQGAGQGQRLGNRITTVYHRLHLLYSITPNNSGSLPNLVTTYVGYKRTAPSTQISTFTGFFHGANANINVQGSLTDNILTVNEDLYVIVAKKSVKIGPAGGLAAQATSYNSDFLNSIKVTLDLTKGTAKKVIFDDGSTNSTGMNLTLFHIVSFADNTAQLSGTISPVVVHFNQEYGYTDS